MADVDMHLHSCSRCQCNMYRSSSLIVQARGPGRSATTLLPVRRLRRCAALHISSTGSTLSTALGLPTVLQDGISCVPTVDQGTAAPGSADEEVFIKVMQPMRMYVLWPALQEPPPWLCEGFELIPGAEVKVRWSFTFSQRVWLNITYHRSAYQDQALTVWQCCNALPAGSGRVLPAPLNASAVSSFGAPTFGYVLCFRTSTSVGTGLASNAATLASKLLLNKDIDPATCSLHQVYVALEEGTFDPTDLEPAEAHTLLQRVMSAGDNELLLMLMEGGIGECCLQPIPQQLMQYAVKEGLTWLAHLLLQSNAVELTEKVLHWLVFELLHNADNSAHIEKLLISYICQHRNPLSAAAAVEHSLRASSASVLHPQQALRLSEKFREVQFVLLQDLMTPSPCQPTSFGCTQLSTPSMLHSTNQACPCSASTPPTVQSMQSVQAVLQACFDEQPQYCIGRGTSHSSTTIHDSSPYEIALRTHNTAFFDLEPILQYTQCMWKGTELQKMQRLLWQQSSASPTLSSTAGSRSRNMSYSLNGSRSGSRDNPAGFSMLQPVTSSKTAVQYSSRLAPIYGDMPACAVLADTSTTYVMQPTASHPNTPPGAVSLGDKLMCSSNMDSSCVVTCSSDISKVGSRQMAPAVHGTDLLEAIRYPARLYEADGVATAAETVANAARTAPGPVAEGVLTQTAATSAPIHSLTSRRSTHTQHSRHPGSTEGLAAPMGQPLSNTSWLNPLLGVELLRNTGLVGESSQTFAHTASLLLHTMLLAPRAMHNSPKGRWIKHCIFQLLFLILFQTYVTGHMHPMLYWAFLLLVIGNVVDIFLKLHYKRHGNLRAYLADNWATVDVVVNFGLLALLLMHLLTHTLHLIYGGQLADEDISVAGVNNMSILASSLAVWVWARALVVAVPLTSGLGALLCTVEKAMREASVMAPAVIVLMVGFGSALAAAYSNVIPEYSSILGAMRMLVSMTGGDLHLTIFDEHAGGSSLLAVWGQVLAILYIIVVNIILMTLLIAVINHTYDPKHIKKEAVIMQAEMSHHYAFHVRYGLACSPVNVLQLALMWLPHGLRTRRHCFTSVALWFGLDGYVPAAAVAEPDFLIATGPTEVGYLVYLLVMYPIMGLLAVTCMLLHMPSGVWYFAYKGHRMWLNSSWDHVDTRYLGGVGTASRFSIDRGGRPAAMSRRGSLDMLHRRSSIGSPIIGNGANVGAATLGRSRTMILRHASEPEVVWVPVHHSFDLEWICSLRIVVAMKHVCLAAGTPVMSLVMVVFAAILAVVLQVLLLLLTVLVLVWSFLARVVFSLYCIFLPAAADYNVCLQPTRNASFWSTAGVLAALAKVTNSSTTKGQHGTADEAAGCMHCCGSTLGNASNGSNLAISRACSSNTAAGCTAPFYRGSAATARDFHAQPAADDGAYVSSSSPHKCMATSGAFGGFTNARSSPMAAPPVDAQQQSSSGQLQQAHQLLVQIQQAVHQQQHAINKLAEYVVSSRQLFTNPSDGSGSSCPEQQQTNEVSAHTTVGPCLTPNAIGARCLSHHVTGAGVPPAVAASNGGVGPAGGSSNIRNDMNNAGNSNKCL